MKSFLLEIRNKYKELRISERKVADAILEEKVNILDCTIEDFFQDSRSQSADNY